MDKEFTKYAEAFALRELGFNEPCFGRWWFRADMHKLTEEELEIIRSNYFELPEHYILAPTYSQAFRWFREKYDLDHDVLRMPISILKIQEKNRTNHIKKYSWSVDDKTANPTSVGGYLDDYEESELECLKKLIEIVKTKQPSK